MKQQAITFKKAQKNILMTKSRYVSGLECKKYIWLAFNKPEELPKPDEAAQHKFDEGHKVGELAKSLFPEGIEITEVIPIDNEKKSKELINKKKPLFEAGFFNKDGKCYARADILVPVENDKWDIYEVKSTCSVKEEHIEDVAFQRFCYESAGLQINKCFLMHINNQYVRKGKIETGQFFVRAEITDEVDEIISEVPSKIKNLFDVIALPVCPEIGVGDSCCLGSKNYVDRYEELHKTDSFWNKNPNCNIFDLYWGGKKAVEWFNSGVLEIKDLCDKHKLNEKQKIQQKCTISGKHHCDCDELKKFIDKINYPLYFLDFETYMTAIPLYDGLKPYQQIPFQFSLHIIKDKGEKPKHYSFIAEGSEDPRPKFIEELKKVIGTKGNIISYNQSFEQSRLEEIGEFLPKHKKDVQMINKRMMDLLIPFRNFSYYHPAQKGSASIKHVLPALTGESYADYEIGNGADASLSYLYITHGNGSGKKATNEEIKKVRADLKKYCSLDTEGMIWILDKLQEQIGGN